MAVRVVSFKVLGSGLGLGLWVWRAFVELMQRSEL